MSEVDHEGLARDLAPLPPILSEVASSLLLLVV